MSLGLDPSWSPDYDNYKEMDYLSRLYLTFRLVDETVTEKNIQSRVMELQSDEYKTLLILHHISEMFMLRHQKKPNFKQSNNLYIFWTDSLQALYHTSNNLDESMIIPEIRDIVFIQSKHFKRNPDDIQGHSVQLIYQDLFSYSFLDRMFCDMSVLDNVQFYKDVNMGDKTPIIKSSDPLVQILGAKVGQFIRIDQLNVDGQIYHEINYRYVTDPQYVSQDVATEEDQVILGE